MKTLAEINKVHDKHCRACLIYRTVKTKFGQGSADRKCLHECQIGKQLQKLGRRLEQEYEKMRRERRMKNVS